MLKNTTILILVFCLNLVRPVNSQTPEARAADGAARNFKRQNLTISGKITDWETGESLPFATVYVRNGDRMIATRSNVDGFFTLTPVPSDTSSLTLTYVGYRNTTYTLTPDSPLMGLNISMKPDETHLDEVMVRGEKTEIMKANETISMIKMLPSKQILNGKLYPIINWNSACKPGVRLTYFDVTGKSYAEPRFSAAYNLTDKFRLKGAAGVYYQFVKQINREDISQGNRNFWILSDGNTLPVTRSNHLILGGSYETPLYLFDVEFYNKYNTGITEYTLRFVPKVGQGLAADQTFYNGKETIRGMDLLVQRKFGAFTGWLGYTWSEAQRNIAAFSDKPYYSDQDVRHQFKSVGSFHYQPCLQDVLTIRTL